MAAQFPVKQLSPAELLDHPLNWGTHSEEQTAALGYSLGKFGWLKPVIVNERSGRIIDGHARVAHARNLGLEKIPCRVVDVDEATEAEMLSLIDRVGEMRGRDEGNLSLLLEVVKSDRGGADPVGWEGKLANLKLAFAPPSDEELTFEADGGDAELPDFGDEKLPQFDEGALPVETHVRQVQLFYDGTTHPEFMSLAQDLQGAFAAETLSDAVLDALRFAHHKLVEFKDA